MARIERFEDIRAWQETQFDTIYDKAAEVKQLINGFIGYLKRSSQARPGHPKT